MGAQPTPPTHQELSRVVQRLAQLLVWPLRRFFLPQFAWVRAQILQSEYRMLKRADSVDERLAEIEEVLATGSQASSDGIGLLAMEVGRLADRVDALEGAPAPESLAPQHAFVARHLGSEPGAVLCLGGRPGVAATVHVLGRRVIELDEGQMAAGDLPSRLEDVGTIVWVADRPPDDVEAAEMLADLREAARTGARLVVVVTDGTGGSPDDPGWLGELLQGWSDVTVETTLVPAQAAVRANGASEPAGIPTSRRRVTVGTAMSPR
jgi:hypothetical protein